MLGLLCKFSLEPDTCVRKTESLFARRGASALLIAKFVPGMGVVAMSLSGMIRMRRSRFLLFDAGGASLWALTYLLAGFIFHRQVDAIIVGIGLLGRRAGVVVAILIGAHLAVQVFSAAGDFCAKIRINRISPEALGSMLASGKAVTVVDLRHPVEVEREGMKIAGALIRPDELRSRSAEIPRNQEVILYCTCPNEATSARSRSS